MRVTVYMATSLDGFIADESGSVDWLNDLPAPEDTTEDYGYSALINKVDRLVMGRKTFDQVLGFGSWPYGDLPVTVLTHQEPPINLPAEATVSFTQGAPETVLKQFETQGDTHIYLDGGNVVQSFLKAGYVDEFILTQVPILLGNGISLFNTPLPEEDWVVKQVNSYSNGFNQTHLKRKGSDT